MLKLKDIFPKWLLRERSYGDVVLGAQVFEIHNLVVPAGTNLDNAPITVGTFDVDPSSSLVPSLSLLTDVVPDPGLSLTLAIVDAQGNALVPTAPWVVLLGASNQATDVIFEGIAPIATADGQQSPNVPMSVVAAFGLEYNPVSGDPETAPPATVKIAVQLQGSGGALVAPVTVVRARAAFLVV